jgi:preprotein translocase subunit YajC
MATMMRKLLVLVVIVAAVWFGARALVHRGEVRATVVFDNAGALRKGDPVVADGKTIGVVRKVTHLEDTDAVSIAVNGDHRRDIVSDSLFAIRGDEMVVTNTFAVGSPIADGAVLRARTDGVSAWLSKHGSAVQPFIAKIKKAADDEIDKLDQKHFDDELADLKSKVPEWKAEGADALDHHIDRVRKQAGKIEDDLRRSNHAADAKKIKEKFDKWLDEVQR